MAYVSHSQADEFSDCNRHWWFSRVERIPGESMAHLIVGSVLHEVLERYTGAVDGGRVPFPKDLGTEKWPQYDSVQGKWVEGVYAGQSSGEPVELFPKGWETFTERDGSKYTITPNEAKLVRGLVKQGIELGVAMRAPGTQCELDFKVKLSNGDTFVGLVDVYRRAGEGGREMPYIEDHKSYGNENYIMLEKPDSPRFIGKNKQLLRYCWAVCQLSGWDGPMRVQHNQYPKKSGRKPTKVSAIVPQAEIQAAGAEVADIARRMAVVRQIKQWEDVDGPEDNGKCYRWYGKPCQFAGICAKTETVEGLTARMARQQSPEKRLNLPLATSTRRKPPKESGMSIFDRINKGAAAPAAAPAATPAPETAAPVQDMPLNGGEAPPASAPVGNPAPWANPECPACKGRGVNSSGAPCQICDATSKRRGLLPSGSYIVESGEDGMLVAVARPEHAEALQAAGMPLEWVQSEETVSTPAPAPKAQETAPTAPQQEAPQQEAPKSAPAAKPSIFDKSAPATKPAPAEAAPAEEAPAKPAQTLERVLPGEGAVAKDSPKEEAKPRTGRKRTGVVIMIGCVPLRGNLTSRPLHSSAEVLERFGAELARDMGQAGGYWALDPFKRRERLAQKADYMVEELGRSVVYHIGALGNDDLGSLVNALTSQSEGVEAIIVRAG